MYVVGLTGGIGSGKSTVAKLFAQKGIAIIDADQITRELTSPDQPALEAIVKHFSRDILDNAGLLDRKKLGKIIFDLPHEKYWLEALLHPLVRTTMKQQVLKATSPYCITMIPLLLETSNNPLINRILVVDASEKIQLQRTQARDQSPIDQIQAILETQVTRAKRLSSADDIIDNNGELKDLIPQVEKYHQLYSTLAKIT